MTIIEVKPTKPWAATPADRFRDIVILLGAIVASFLFVAATPMKGKLAYFFTFFLYIFFTLFYFINYCTTFCKLFTTHSIG